MEVSGGNMLVNGEKLNVRTLKNVNLLKEDNVKNVRNVREYAKAEHLVGKFERLGCDDAPNCFNYFVKCFKSLPESTIWNIYENAANNPSIKSPIKYFIAACRNQMA